MKSRRQNSLKSNCWNNKLLLNNLRKEIHATKSVAIVYLAFCVCWMPCCVITTINHVDETFFQRLLINNKSLFLIIYYTFVDILPLFNTMLNPLIYSFSNAQFRSAVQQVWKKLNNKNIHKESISSISGRRRSARSLSTTLIAEYRASEEAML